jgi:N-acetylmuramoyl-L-alanine amidase
MVQLTSARLHPALLAAAALSAGAVLAGCGQNSSQGAAAEAPAAVATAVPAPAAVAPALTKDATTDAAAVGTNAAATAASAPTKVPAAPQAAALRASRRPLAGLVIALDPGHQLGNSNPRFRKQLAQTIWNGTITKGCNTTGTATNRGYEEATFNWKVALKLKAKLESLGATVPMTRSTNDFNHWGPCVWKRGMFGAKVHARLMIQIHADGASSSGHGFYVITPGLTRNFTDHLWHGQQIWKADLALAKAMKKGLVAAGDTPSTYVSGAILTMYDQTGMNFARVPTVTVENGNMRNAGDAARMSSSSGQSFYATALLRGIRTYLGR